MKAPGFAIAFAVAMFAVAMFAAAGPGRADTPRADPSRDGRRIALIIGNSAYRNVEHLPNARNDATLMADTLRSLGFTIVGGDARIDLDRQHLAEAVRQFGQALQGAEVALFYYSGHGLQVNGVNWLVPVDANPASERDLDFQMVDADLVLRQMDGAGTRLNVVLLDACRNNPFTISGVRGLRSGLAEMRAPEGTLISYATQPGNVAQDGRGADSPYTKALVQGMRQPGLDIFRLFNQVGLQVKRTTGGSQQPWVSTSPIDGDFYFSGPPRAPDAPPTAAVTAPPNVTALLTPPSAPAAPPAPSLPAAPPVASPTAPPAASPVASPADAVRDLLAARELPCSALVAHAEGNSTRIEGIAQAGPGWEQLVKQIGAVRSIHVGQPLVDFVPPFACPLIDVLGAAVRRTLSDGHRMIQPLTRDAITPTSLTVTLRHAGAGSLRLDVFQADGTVLHPAIHRTDRDGDVTATLTMPASLGAGAHVLTAIVTPEVIATDATASESTSAYLAALTKGRGTLSEAAFADLTVFEVTATAPPAPPRVRPATPAAVASTVPARPSRSPRCAAILERAQLGDVSDADRAFLQASCR